MRNACPDRLHQTIARRLHAEAMVYEVKAAIEERSKALPQVSNGSLGAVRLRILGNVRLSIDMAMKAENYKATRGG
jgi:hypothetical protein